MYRLLFDHVLTRLDPERAHHLAAAAIRWAGVSPLAGLVRRRLQPSGAEIEVMGIRFPGRFGLAAGFDKDARMVRGLTMLGFAFVEVGTITAHAQPGNDAPRLWRVREQQALRNRMGFNNDGAAVVAERLRALRATKAGRDAIIGVNIGRTKVAPDDRVAEDYAVSARLLAPFADYLVVNVSSPNTPGLRDLQQVDALRPVLQAVRAAADAATPRHRTVPLLVKIAPDLADQDVDAVADLVTELGLAGVVAVNTTVQHDLGPGGLSGPPLLERGLSVVRRLREHLGPEVCLMAAGGVSSPHDAVSYRDAGADLVQGYTAFVYQGPFWAARLNRALAAREGR